jgi:hypothetical protein
MEKAHTRRYQQIRTATCLVDLVLHAAGHAVGMFDVTDTAVMSPSVRADCPEIIPTDKERYHAGLIYSRPRGNASPDHDPLTFTLGVQGGPHPQVQR